MTRGDSLKKWRVVHTIANDLGKYAQLFKKDDVKQFLVPLFYRLSHERMAQIRHASSNAFGKLLLRFKED
jgi:hypothetical protein